MSEPHEPTENYRRFTRASEVLEFDQDWALVLSRLNGGDWEVEECNWEGEAEERLDERTGEALAQGWIEDDAARTSLAEALASTFGALPAAYEAFLAQDRGATDGLILRGAPQFAADHALIVELDNLRIASMDFCGQNGDQRYLPISAELRDQGNPHGDPHALFFALDRQGGAVVLVSAGAITPAYERFEDFVAALSPA